MKKVFAVLVLAMVVAGGVFAQENTSRAKNTVMGGPNVGLLTFGLDVEYERILLENLGKGSLGIAGEVGYTTVIIFPIFYIDARARWYPWSGKFFADLGLGYSSFLGVTSAFMISGEVGWRIDIGKPNGWIFSPSLAYNQFIAGDTDDFSGSLPKINVRIGYAF
jgi:hypothetical protein